jgi:hypothetical protein
MMLLILVAMTAVVVVLTLSFLGTLRGIAELRLRILGHDFTGREPMRVDPGRGLPIELTTAFPVWTKSQGAILFLADDCSACLKLADDLRSLRHAEQFLVCPTSKSRERLEALVPASMTMLSEELAAHVTSNLNVTMTPVAVIQQDGYIVGRGFGPGAETIEAIEHLWSAGFGDDDAPESNGRPERRGERWILTRKAS